MFQASKQKGFSLVELLVVVAVVAILAAMAAFTFSNVGQYSADDQAKKIVDIFDEARQKSLNQRTTFRVEINKTKNRIFLIDENVPGQADDDVIVKTYNLSTDVVIGAKPSNVQNTPAATSPIPVPNYVASSYPLSAGDQKITLRFRRNGQVVDTGNDHIGTGSLTTGATIYVHSKKPSVEAPNVVRAVTVLGSSGDTALLKCQFDSSNRCISWNK